jgi:hypothetical protein
VSNAGSMSSKLGHGMEIIVCSALYVCYPIVSMGLERGGADIQRVCTCV